MNTGESFNKGTEVVNESNIIDIVNGDTFNLLKEMVEADPKILKILASGDQEKRNIMNYCSDDVKSETDGQNKAHTFKKNK